jgi:hypothetical protein
VREQVQMQMSEQLREPEQVPEPEQVLIQVPVQEPEPE